MSTTVPLATKVRSLTFSLSTPEAVVVAKALIRQRDTCEEGVSSYHDADTGEEVTCQFWRGWTTRQVRSLTLHCRNSGNALHCDFGSEGSLFFAADVVAAMAEDGVYLEGYSLVNPEPKFVGLEKAAYEAHNHGALKEFAEALVAARDAGYF